MMKNWWLALNPRERAILAIAGVGLAAAVFFLAIWEPVFKQRDQLQVSVESQRSSLAWMEGSVAKLKDLRAASDAQRILGGNQSLLSIVDQTSKQANLRKYIQRMEPESGDGVRVWVDNADFDQLAQWLGNLERRYGVATARATIDHGDKPGIIDARLSLNRP